MPKVTDKNLKNFKLDSHSNESHVRNFHNTKQDF